MDSAILSLLGAFVLSIMGLFVFIWSRRCGDAMPNLLGDQAHLGRRSSGSRALSAWRGSRDWSLS